jgi:broad specificity phosphatase PhoE
MPILVVRHALSEANNRDNVGTLAFAAEGAPLMDKGEDQAREGAMKLRDMYGVTPATTSVAVSHLLRTRQTALVMGFPEERITAYRLLDEVAHGMEGITLRAMLDGGELPPAAFKAAEALLAQPPAERVWVTHGLVIAALSNVLGVSGRYERLIPRFCEVRELPL